MTPETDTSSAGAPEWLDDALAVANIPTLACLLVQLTGERKWIEGRFVPSQTRGLDDNDDGGLPPEVQAEIREAAGTAIAGWFAGRPPALTAPSDDLLCEMMSVSLGEKIPIDYAPMIRHELRLPPAGESEQDGRAAIAPSGFRALIIGAGISGLCAAIEFERVGIEYRIVERSENVGGVWHENRYPGAACDVPSHLYSFSFAPYRWSRYFAGSREIHRYLADFAKREAIVDKIDFGMEVEEAVWLEDEGKWQATATGRDGKRETFVADILVSAVGAFNKPRIPHLPGIDSFRGPSLHTARYPDEGLELAGKRVVLVGNGASAMQVAPAIVDEVASLSIVQRTPQWVAPFPKFGQAIPEPLQQLLDNMPLYRLWYRLRLSWAFNDKLYDALQQDREWLDAREQVDSINPINDAHRRGLTAYMEAELGEARELLPRLLPDYPPFGKRMLLDNGWFRTLARPHVNLVTGGVIEVGEDHVVTSDGESHGADVIIWATGFDVVNLIAPMKVTGKGGRTLEEEWEGDNARAYLGTVVPGFPNFFCLYGPNTQFGHGGSLISVLERQMHYVMSLLNRMFEQDVAVLEVRRDIHEDYNRRVDEAHDRMIWTLPNVDGYYRNSKGRIVVNNPFRILDVWRMTERARLEDYHLQHRTGTGQLSLSRPLTASGEN